MQALYRGYEHAAKAARSKGVTMLRIWVVRDEPSITSEWVTWRSDRYLVQRFYNRAVMLLFRVIYAR